MDSTEKVAQVVAEMLFLGKWKMRVRILRKLKKEEHLAWKQISYILIMIFFSDICKILYGKEWLIKVVQNKEEENENL